MWLKTQQVTRLQGVMDSQGQTYTAWQAALQGPAEGFRYSASLAAYGEAGNVWDEEAFVAYVQDPTAYLREALGDNGARSAMSFRVRGEEDARNLYAYLQSLATE